MRPTEALCGEFGVDPDPEGARGGPIGESVKKGVQPRPLLRPDPNRGCPLCPRALREQSGTQKLRPCPALCKWDPAAPARKGGEHEERQ